MVRVAFLAKTRTLRRGSGLRLRDLIQGALAAMLLASGVVLYADDRPADFGRDVRPILAEQCLECHGPQTQESGLRLDHRVPALRGGDAGKVIVPGDSAQSELFRRVSTMDESLRMPPADGEHRALSPAQIATIRDWIDQGAAWPDDGGALRIQSEHWAYQPLHNREPTALENDDWSRNPLDRFVLARLRESGVNPSPPADRRTLLRRLHYDLVGLPPRPDEVDDFVTDASPDAVHKRIDRLLASPRFGERWGRHWLDKARYADSDGYEKDNPRPDAWRYRDWVIGAINADLPFDRFTIEQLAGDLLPDATPEQKLATAFHRQTLTNTEGGVDQEQFRIEAIFDRVNTTGAVWLGLTVGCAQCHTHKYDQITQAEYYQLFAFFNNADETTADVPVSRAAVAEYDRQKAAFDARVAELQGRLDDRRAELAPRLAEWERAQQAKLSAEFSQPVQFHSLDVLSIESTGGVKFENRDDGSFLATGDNPDSVVYTIRARTDLANITGFKLEALADDSLPANGPGRVAHGNFVLNEFAVHASEDVTLSQKQPVRLVSVTADFSQGDWDVAGTIDRDPQTGWAVAPQFGKDHESVFVTAEPLNSDGQTLWLEVVLSQNYGLQHTIGRLRLEVRTGMVPGEGIPENVREVLAVAPDQRTAAHRDALLAHFASLDAEYAGLQQQMADLQKSAPERPFMNVRVLAERMSDPRTTRLLRRGDFLQAADPVEPGTLAVLHEYEPRETGGRSDRLDLARWLIDPDNPLTPRVAVNHVWSHLFGRGLVRTMNDFGTRGEKPTHPELLDWLARDFSGVPGKSGSEDGRSKMEDGPDVDAKHQAPSTKYERWSRKRLIRLIVTSAAYQQSSHHRPELADVDPQNNLLHRQNRFRVEAEIVRDVCLAASGLLSQKVGGPSVFPPMPPDIAALSYAGNFQWSNSAGDDRYRRGMYTFFKRTAPYPNLMTFDCPDANTTAVERSTSNTPLMALTTLNDTAFVEASQALAQRVLEDDSLGSDNARLDDAFQRCVGRAADDHETTAFLELLEASRRWYAAHSDDATALVGAHAPAGAALPEAAAWVVVCRTVLNMDEFVTRE